MTGAYVQMMAARRGWFCNGGMGNKHTGRCALSSRGSLLRWCAGSEGAERNEGRGGGGNRHAGRKQRGSNEQGTSEGGPRAGE